VTGGTVSAQRLESLGRFFLLKQSHPSAERFFVRLTRSLFFLLALLAWPALLAAQSDAVGTHGWFQEMYRDYEREHPLKSAGEGYAISPLARTLAKPALTREVFGYFPYWFSNRWNLLDYELVSTIAYFSAEVNSNGSIGSVHGWPRYAGDPSASADVVSMINAAHGAGVRVVLCLTNFDAGSLALLLATPDYRTTLIQQSLALVEAGAADGVNINFEGIPSASRNDLTDFMHALVDSFHARLPGSQVSCAPTDFDTRSGDWDLAALQGSVDLFFFQGYGYHYGGSSSTGPVGLLPNTAYWGSLNITTLMDFVLARMAPEKVILGLPHFGYRWPAASPDPKATTLASGTAFYYPDAVSYASSYGRQWDVLGLAPWFRYEAAGTWYQGWYDDPESMAYKYDLVLERNLMGVGMWALGMDAANHDIWDVLGAYFGDSTGVARPPAAPVLSLVADSSTPGEGRAWVTWQAEGAAVLGGFRLYLSTEPATLPQGALIREDVLGPASRSTLVTGLQLDSTYYCTLVAVDTSGTALSTLSDTYGVALGSGVRYLVVDGFDRTSASYNLPQHSFAASYGAPIVAAGRVFDCADNNAVVAGARSLSGYAGVLWFLGDESVADQSFSPAEQALLAAYMEQGGRLFVSGSEIGYDLDRSASPNYAPAWYSGVLKASYIGDAATGTAFSGDQGSIFEGIAGAFGQVYPEDYPDIIAPAGGASAAMHYNPSQVAAISYRGTFGSGSAEGCVVYLAFTFETIASAQTRNASMARILDFFEGVAGIEPQREIPAAIALLQNYPNPFNPTTTIEFALPRAGHVSMKLYDVLGREIATLLEEPLDAGRHRLAFDGGNLPSGTYFYVLRAEGTQLTQKMQVLK
jgi:spore germination protein YaaH